jgi:hypothetical protein
MSPNTLSALRLPRVGTSGCRPRPGVGRRAPLGEAGLVAKQQESTAPLRLRQNGRPGLLPPDAAALGVQVVGDVTRKRVPGFLVTIAEVARERGRIMVVVAPAELPLDQILHEAGAPAA